MCGGGGGGGRMRNTQMYAQGGMQRQRCADIPACNCLMFIDYLMGGQSRQREPAQPGLCSA